jgi:hypothetical protein
VELPIPVGLRVELNLLRFRSLNFYFGVRMCLGVWEGPLASRSICAFMKTELKMTETRRGTVLWVTVKSLKLYGGEPFLRSHQLCSHSRISQ